MRPMPDSVPLKIRPRAAGSRLAETLLTPTIVGLEMSSMDMASADRARCSSSAGADDSFERGLSLKRMAVAAPLDSSRTSSILEFNEDNATTIQISVEYSVA